MGIKSSQSTYFFIGRLSDHTAKYQVQQEPLLTKFYFEVFLDGISIWGSTSKNFNDLLKEIKEIFNTVVSAFAFKTNKPLSYSLIHWVEAKEVVATKNLIGWLYPPFSPIKPLSQKNKLNAPWKKAVWIYRNLYKLGDSNHRLALKDYHSALKDTSEDAFLFAYRAVEDICRAVTGCDEIQNTDWQTMHQKLGTSKKLIDPLTKVATKVRHGNTNHRIVKNARKNREKLIKIAHDVLEKEFKRTFPKF